jgi:hypothetical protein
VTRAVRLALLIGAPLLAIHSPAVADCGLNSYPALSGYGYDSDQCKAYWQRQDWNRVVQACTSDAQDAGADRHDFLGLTIAAQSWAKVAIAYDRLGQPEPSRQARSKALAEIQAAIDGFKGEKPDPDNENAENASGLRDSIAASNFYSVDGCRP